MIKPTKELVEWIESFEPQYKLAILLNIEVETLSRIKNGKQSASRQIIEAMNKVNGWPLSKAWEITDEKSKDN